MQIQYSISLDSVYVSAEVMYCIEINAPHPLFQMSNSPISYIAFFVY